MPCGRGERPPALGPQHKESVINLDRDDPVESLLADATSDGVITGDVADALRRYAAGRGGAATGRSPAEALSGFNVVTVAYGVGALLVLFAGGWFLADRWDRLGAPGVLAVSLTYAAIFVACALWLRRHDFPLASGVATVLAVSVTPLVAWALLTLAGEWPDPRSGSALLHAQSWMAARWLVLDLSTLLVALAVLRRHKLALLMYPLAFGVWAASFHVVKAVLGEGSHEFQRWAMLVFAFVIVAIADAVERWQRASVASGGVSGTRGALNDFAGPFWSVGLVAFTFPYMQIWNSAGTAKHVMPVIAVALIAMSLYLRRRVLLLVGVLGIFGYLGYLAGNVFRDVVSFPILLAGLGTLLILATVWTQSRFPALARRLDERSRASGRVLPWSATMSMMPAVWALGMAGIALMGREEEQRQRDFEQRLFILRLHSGSIEAPHAMRTERPDGSPAPPEAGRKGRAPRPN
ncbi:MAG: hypothetical protein ABIZ91_13110 [Gemmatimonadaceae bacterium]